MAVKSSWSPGDVLAAADLTDTFGAKATYSYGTAVPAAPATGQIWMDTTAGTASPVAKVYTGSGWVSFSGGWANFSDTPTGTYTDADGTWKYKTYTSGTSSLTITTAGYIDVVVVSGGAGGNAGVSNGPGGRTVRGIQKITAATHTVTVGAGGASGGGTGLASVLGPFDTGNVNTTAGAVGNTSFTSSITGSSLTYARSAQATPVANRGEGGIEAGSIAGTAGVVIVRVKA